MEDSKPRGGYGNRNMNESIYFLLFLAYQAIRCSGVKVDLHTFYYSKLKSTSQPVTFHWSEFTGREPFIFLPGSLLDALHVVVDASAVQFFPTCFMPGLPLLPPLRVTPGSSLHQSRRPRPS